jgi:hypothetical protein
VTNNKLAIGSQVHIYLNNIDTGSQSFINRSKGIFGSKACSGTMRNNRDTGALHPRFTIP